MGKIKQFASGIVKTIKSIINGIKFFSTYVGWVVAALILIVFIVIAVTVLVNTCAHMLAEFLGDDVGISSDADYEYMVSSLGYAGYDSLISEKNWQEYMAYEYSVLMDVAEYLYDGQKDYIEQLKSGAIEYRGPNDEGPATMPYIYAEGEYDASKMTDEHWLEAVLAGQVSERFGITTPYPEMLTEKKKILGGNPNVALPIISYEFKLNTYEDTQGSLVPYINVVRDDLVYHYYTTANRDKFASGKASNLAKEDVKLLEINYHLNDNNGILPKSVDYAYDKINYQGDDPETINTGNEDYWPIAEDKFESELYFNDTYDSVTYKISLQTLIDRYLPKASLLTNWFMLKDTDFADSEGTGKELAPELGTSGSSNHENNFMINDLLKDMKGIYNYYCWNGETINTESVESVQYDEKQGTVIRDPMTGEAQMVTKEKNYASTNKETFIKFVQVGLETNRFDVYKKYEPAKGDGKAEIAGKTTTMPKAQKEITGDDEEATLPVVNDLLSDQAYFLNDMEIEAEFTYDYVEDVYLVSGDELIYQGSRTGTGTATDSNIYLSGEAEAGVGFSKSVLNVVVKPAETLTSNDSTVVQGESINGRGPQENFLNYEYVLAFQTKELEDGKISAELPPTFYDSSYKDHVLSCYNFGIGEDEGDKSSTQEEIQGIFEEDIQDILDLETTKEALEPYFTPPEVSDDSYEDGDTIVERTIVDGSVKINKLNLKLINFQHVIDIITPDNPNNPNRAVFDVREEETALKLDIYQKRLSAVLVDEVETWAKHAKYDIKVIQNTFEPQVKQHVIPHNRFNFGVETFNVEENAIFRTEYYKQYFSKVAGKEPGVKEADVLSMLMTWEEYGNKGVSSAYNFMRDLYQLVMHLREKGKEYDENNMPKESWTVKETNMFGVEVEKVVKNDNYATEIANYQNPYILSTAYSYLYLPETIWGFREGKTQEIFWTERLAAKENGNPDALSLEEQEKVVTKDNEISWQIMDYEDYDECQNGDKTRVYGLFPFGNELVRTYFAEQAIESGEFDDGGFTSGHQGADWHARRKITDIMAAAASKNYNEIPGKIYEYELKARTLRNILQGKGSEEKKYDSALAFVGGDTTSEGVRIYYDAAKESLDKFLKESEVKASVVAIAPGVVQSAGYNCVSGFYVKLSHDGQAERYVTRYVHFRRWPEVDVGDVVGAGTLLGHEGDTGNSTGNHLHFEVVINGTNNSPSKYVAPIFTPFYNIDKITEFLSEHEKYPYNEKELILSTEYMSLTRTVLMARFDGSGKVTEIKAPDARLLESVSIIEAIGRDGTKGEYLYAKDGGGRYYQMLKDENLQNACIIKTGVEPKVQFYKVTFEILEKSIIKDGKVEYDLWDNGRLFKVLTKTSVSPSSVPLDSGINILTGVGTWGSADVNWGITTPHTALLENYDDLVDRGIFDAEEEYDIYEYYDSKTAWKNHCEENDDLRNTISGDWNIPEKDVRVSKEYFSADKLKEKFKEATTDAKVLMHYADATMAYAVPFYEGPFSEAYAASMSTTPGSYGALLRDLAAMQEAMIARGFDNSTKEDPLNTDGYYDSVTTSVVKNAGTKIKDIAGTIAGYENVMINQGAFGKDPGVSGFGGAYSIEGVVAWNTYITFGTYGEAKRASEAAIANAATHYPSANYWTLMAICDNESGFIPSNESQLLFNQAHTITLNFGNLTDEDKQAYLFNYKGENRILRRAQGLFQIAPPNIKQYYPTDETALIAVRTPYANAFIGAKMVDDARKNLVKDYMSEIKAMAAMDNWKNLGKEAGKDPVDIILEGLSAFSLNVGYGNVSEAFEPMKSMTYESFGTQEDKKFKINGCPNYVGRIIGSYTSAELDNWSPKNMVSY